MQLLHRPSLLRCTLLLTVTVQTLISQLAVAHNITHLLAGHPNFSIFNHYLSLTHLNYEINSRTTITVLAVSDSAISSLSNTAASSPTTLKNILSLHVLLDYFGSQKLHELSNATALVATLFQTTGRAPGSSGFVNITDLKGGKVSFAPEDESDSAHQVYFVRSLEEVPYNISVIEISGVIPSDVAAAPTAQPSELNVTDVMAAHGCREFGNALSGNTDVMKTYEDNVVGGLTVFCPLDDPFKTFLPKFRNLSAADQVSFLDFYGVPIYMSMSMLRSSNGLMNTLATDGPNRFDLVVQDDGQGVILKTKVNTVKITGTLLDQQPLATYSLDEVLLPQELFKEVLAPAPAPVPAPAPTPEKAAESPKVAAKHKSPPAPPTSALDSPADSPSGTVADQKANESLGICRVKCGFLTLSLLLAVLVL